MEKLTFEAKLAGIGSAVLIIVLSLQILGVL